MRHPSHHLRLNRDFHSDLEWWHRFLKGWNGTSRCAQFDPKRPNVVIPLDRAGRWGCGAYPEEGDCSIQYKWQEDIVEANIKVKELLPIVMDCTPWGREWTACTVLAQCDNEAVVADINGGYSKENDIMHLLRCLFFSASFQLKIYAKNIPVKHNELADALSRKNFRLFQEFRPTIAQPTPIPIPIPPQLVELLITTKPDWLSQDWTYLFRNIFNIQ